MGLHYKPGSIETNKSGTIIWATVIIDELEVDLQRKLVYHSSKHHHYEIKFQGARYHDGRRVYMHADQGKERRLKIDKAKYYFNTRDHLKDSYLSKVWYYYVGDEVVKIFNFTQEVDRQDARQVANRAGYSASANQMYRLNDLPKKIQKRLLMPELKLV